MMCERKSIKSSMKIAFLAIFVLSLSPVLAHATTISLEFNKITNNNVENLGVSGTNQLSLTIYDQLQAPISINANEVLFDFRNNVGTASDVTEIYVDDGSSLSAISSVQDLAGSTTFSTANALNPGNLPGGNTVNPPFVATAGLSIDSDQPGGGNGIDAAVDILGIVYTTTGGFVGVRSAILTGDLRVGLHVRSIGVAGGSDSYVNTPVPEPTTLLLFGTGLVGVGIATRRRGRKES